MHVGRRYGMVVEYLTVCSILLSRILCRLKKTCPAVLTVRNKIVKPAPTGASSACLLV
jgi:hypothetical protein